MATLVKGSRAKGPRADDLAVLHPDREVVVRGDLWTVREYGLLEAARLHALGTQALASIDADLPDWPIVVALIAVATGKGEIEIGGLPDEEFDRVFAAWRELNLVLFEPIEAKPGKGAAWSDVYTALIASGHEVERIGKYTGRQIDLYYRAAIKRQRRQRAERISDVNLAMNGGSEAKQQMRDLQQGA